MKMPVRVSANIKDTKLKTIFNYFVFFIVIFAVYQIGFRVGDNDVAPVMRTSRPEVCDSFYASDFEEGCEVDRHRPIDDMFREDQRKEAQHADAEDVNDLSGEQQVDSGEDELSDEDWGRIAAEWRGQTQEADQQTAVSNKNIADPGKQVGGDDSSKGVLSGWFGKSKTVGGVKAKTKNNSTRTRIGNPSDIRNRTKVAVMIETRMLDKIPPMVQHFTSVLGPRWPVIIYTTEESYEQYTNSTSKSFKRLVTSGRIDIRKLPPGTEFPNLDEYSRFLTGHWLWEQLAPAENILVFQGDSMLCANAPMTVDDFLEWDFIGAPITPPLGIGFNGGFSLRKRSSTLRVLDTFDWEDAPTYEDRWYHARLNDLILADQVNKKNITIKIPSYEEAMKFAVETIDYPTPVGVHQARRYPKQETIPLEEYCPEFKLCTGPWGQ